MKQAIISELEKVFQDTYYKIFEIQDKYKIDNKEFTHEVAANLSTLIIHLNEEDTPIFLMIVLQHYRDLTKEKDIQEYFKE